MDFKEASELDDDSKLIVFSDQSMLKDLTSVGKCLATFVNTKKAKEFIDQNRSILLTLLPSGSRQDHLGLVFQLKNAELIWHLLDVPERTLKCTNVTFRTVIDSLALLSTATCGYFLGATNRYLSVMTEPTLADNKWHLVHDLVALWAKAKVNVRTIAAVIREFTGYVRPLTKDDAVNTVKLFNYDEDRFIMLCAVLTFPEYMGWKREARMPLLVVFTKNPDFMKAASDVIEESKNDFLREILPFDYNEYTAKRGEKEKDEATVSQNAKDETDSIMTAEAPGGPQPAKKAKLEDEAKNASVITGWMAYDTFAALIKQGKRAHLIEVYRVVDGTRLEPEQDDAIAIAICMALSEKMGKLQLASKPWPFAARELQGKRAMIWPDVARDTEYAFIVEGKLICADR